MSKPFSVATNKLHHGEAVIMEVTEGTRAELSDLLSALSENGIKNFIQTHGDLLYENAGEMAVNLGGGVLTKHERRKSICCRVQIAPSGDKYAVTCKETNNSFVVFTGFNSGKPAAMLVMHNQKQGKNVSAFYGDGPNRFTLSTIPLDTAMQRFRRPEDDGGTATVVTAQATRTDGWFLPRLFGRSSHKP